MAKRIITLVLALVGTFLTIFLSTRGSAGYSSFGGSVSAWINDTFFHSNLSGEEVVSIGRFGWKAVGHVSLYLGTGLCYYLFFDTFPGLRYKKAILVGIGILLSSLGEATQLFTPTRSATLGDIAINFSSFLSLPAVIGLFRKTN